MKFSFLSGEKFFTPFQARWKNDKSRLRLCVKGRQLGMSYTDSYDTVIKAATRGGKDVCIISTQRGANTLFNELINDIKHNGNPMGWSFHETPIQKAVDEGLVEKINSVSGSNYTRDEWLELQRRECISEEQWLQEYCCIPA